MKTVLKKLTSIPGPSGNEEKVREAIAGEIADFADEISTDPLGNLICHKKGKGAKVLLTAHMDEIGLVITHVDENGFLRFSNVGGHSPFVLLGSKVMLNRQIPGVIGTEYLEDIRKLKLNKLFIDIGAESKENAKHKVELGDIATFYPHFSCIGGKVIAKALDDRAGCAVLIETIKQLPASSNDLYFAFTVQEEVGIRGARTAAYTVNPDLAIAVDATATGDTPEARRMDVQLGKGPAIKVMDKTLIAHPAVKKLLLDTAQENLIPYQLEVLEYGGTDAGYIHVTRKGVPAGAVSIPTRYVHTANEMVDLDDLQNAVKLLVKVLEKPLGEYLNQG